MTKTKLRSLAARGLATTISCAALALASGCIGLKVERPMISASAPLGQVEPAYGRHATVYYTPSSESDPGVATGRVAQVGDDWVLIQSPEKEIRIRANQIQRIDYGNP